MTPLKLLLGALLCRLGSLFLRYDFFGWPPFGQELIDLLKILHLQCTRSEFQA